MPFHASRMLAILAALACILALAGCGGSRTTICPAIASSSNGVCNCGTTATCIAPGYLYTAGNNQVSGYYVNLGSGALSSPVSTSGPNQSFGMASVNNSFLYVADPQGGAAANLVLGYSINLGTGSLTPVPGSPFSLPPSSGGGPFQMAVASGSPSFLYVADESQIDAFQVDNATGTLTALPGSPFAAGASLYVTIDPRGSLLFASDENPNGSIWAFTINSSTGALTPVAGSPFPVVPGSTTNSRPSAIAVDSTGSFVYTALEFTNQVAGFSISPSGALIPLPGSPYTAGSGPVSLVVSGNFVYVANVTGGTISGYSITSTGDLMPLSGSPFNIQAGMLASESFGQFLYALGPGGEIQGFTINPTSGALSPVSGSPFPGNGGSALTFVP